MTGLYINVIWLTYDVCFLWISSCSSDPITGLAHAVQGVSLLSSQGRRCLLSRCWSLLHIQASLCAPPRASLKALPTLSAPPYTPELGVSLLPSEPRSFYEFCLLISPPGLHTADWQGLWYAWLVFLATSQQPFCPWPVFRGCVVDEQ